MPRHPNPIYPRLALVSLVAMALLSRSADAQQTVKLYAAGSLSAAMNAIAAAVAREHGVQVTLTFGPSGILRERLEKGEAADIFASADMDHPRTLTKAQLSGPTTLFTRNTLCAYTRPEVAVTSQTLLDRMLDPAVKLATSTPVADPAGDYAWQVFRKADGLKPGAFTVLSTKAMQLFGGATTSPSPAVPAGRNATGFFLENRSTDIFLQYCSGAGALRKDLPTLVVVPLPPSLAVGADYGLTVMKNASPAAAIVAQYLLSPAGQRILSDAGFAALGDIRDGPAVQR